MDDNRPGGKSGGEGTDPEPQDENNAYTGADTDASDKPQQQEAEWREEDWISDEDGNRESESEDDPDAGASKVRMELYDWLQCIVSAVLCGIFIFVFFGRTIGVEGDSMRQTLHWNDRVIMMNLFYSPKNGDIVVFKSPSDAFGGTPLVKRVIAVEGQTIDIDFDTGEVYVNGVIQTEPYINELTHSRLSFEGPVIVPDGHVFVMGDNRNHSSDSRDTSRVGMVDTRYILGKVLFILIPGQDEFSARDWRRIGSVYG